jgi:hypothetical protein
MPCPAYGERTALVDIWQQRTKGWRDPTKPAQGSQRPTRQTTARCNQPGADPILLGEFAMPILLWHLPLVIFFGSWDVAVSPSEKRSVETSFDVWLAPETPELPPLRNPAN